MDMDVVNSIKYPNILSSDRKYKEYRHTLGAINPKTSERLLTLLLLGPYFIRLSDAMWQNCTLLTNGIEYFSKICQRSPLITS